MQIANTHKSICASTTTIHGRGANSSRPQDGVNAIEAAASFITYLYRLCDEPAETERDNRFEPPCTSFNAGEITGADAVNIIARETELNWEFRPIPGADADAITARVSDWVETELLPRMRATDANAVFETVRDVLVQPFDAPDSLAERIAHKASGLNSADAVSFQACLPAQAYLRLSAAGETSRRRISQTNLSIGISLPPALHSSTGWRRPRPSAQAL